MATLWIWVGYDGDQEDKGVLCALHALDPHKMKRGKIFLHDKRYQLH